MLRVNCSQLPDISNLWAGVVSSLRYRFVWTRKAPLHHPLSLMASLCVSLRSHRPEQEDHRVPDDRRHRPRQLRLRHSGGGRHARGVWLGNVLQTDPHPSRAAGGRPHRTLRVSHNTLLLHWTWRWICTLKSWLSFLEEKITIHAVCFQCHP